MKFWIAGPRRYGRWARSAPRQRHQDRRQAFASQSHYVYVIRGEHGLAKIGSSYDPDKRCAELQTGSAHHLWVDYRLAVQAPASSVEFGAHEMLKKHRVRNEWFSVPTEAAIAAIHAAAYRLGMVVDGAPAPVSRPRWSRRFWLSAACAAPFWALLALGFPVVAIAFMMVAMVWFGVASLRRPPDAERPSLNTMRWAGVVVAGALTPILPAAVIGALISPAAAGCQTVSTDDTASALIQALNARLEPTQAGHFSSVLQTAKGPMYASVGTEVRVALLSRGNLVSEATLTLSTETPDDLSRLVTAATFLGSRFSGTLESAFLSDVRLRTVAAFSERRNSVLQKGQTLVVIESPEKGAVVISIGNRVCT